MERTISSCIIKCLSVFVFLFFKRLITQSYARINVLNYVLSAIFGCSVSSSLFRVGMLELHEVGGPVNCLTKFRFHYNPHSYCHVDGDLFFSLQQFRIILLHLIFSFIIHLNIMFGICSYLYFRFCDYFYT